MGSSIPTFAQAHSPASANQTDPATFLSLSFQDRRLPGAAAVIIRDGGVQFVGFGKDADGRDITAKTPFYVGSLSKAFTAAAVLQLTEDRRIDLDAPIQRYLPELRLADPRAAAITVRHLLNQTSGLADIAYQEWRMPQPKTLGDLAPRLADVRLVSDPGKQFNYHNPNYEILARLVETASGQPFAVYLREHVFSPLGMTAATTVDQQDERGDGVAIGHVYAFGRYFELAAPRFFINGAGGVVITPEDYARWLTMLMNGGLGANGVRILSPDSVRLAQTPSTTSGEYGFGWNRRGDRISHSGGLPTFSAYAAMEGKFAVAVFAPVAPVAWPSREIALGALDRLHGRSAEPIDADGLWWVDFAVAAGILLMGASSVRAFITARSWARTMTNKPIWRRVLALAPHVAIVGIVVWGVPYLVSRVESWSWFWLWAYAPVWTCALVATACASVIVAATRIIALATYRTRRIGSGEPHPS